MKAEVAVLDSPVSITVLMVSVDVKQHLTKTWPNGIVLCVVIQ